MEPLDQYLDLKGLSRYSSLSVRTLRDYLSDSSRPLRSYCIKRKILVKRTDFDTWMEQYRTDVKTVDHIVAEILGDLKNA